MSRVLGNIVLYIIIILNVAIKTSDFERNPRNVSIVALWTDCIHWLLGSENSRYIFLVMITTKSADRRSQISQDILLSVFLVY